MVSARNPKPATAFDGPQSLRVPGEWSVLLWSIAAIAAGAPVLALFFPQLASFKEIALLLIGAMIYVTLARGRLVGGSVRVHSGQFGHVHEIAVECSQTLRMSAPQVFIRDDPFVPIVAVGIGEPYSLIISAQWVEHVTAGELRFLIGRELAHIEAGHTRLTSLLSVNGRENAVVSILFGAWLRRIEYTADRAGLLCCGSLDAALSAISLSTFHLVGRKIDLAAFAEQQRELEAERSLRIGEWVSSTPYATKRIAALRAFARDQLFLTWSARFEQSRLLPFVPQPLLAGAVSRRMFAGFPRRCCAFLIDALIVGAIAPALPTHFVTELAGQAGGGVPAWLSTSLKLHPAIVDAIERIAALSDNGLFLLYVIALVGIVGQTLGMMIVDLRVVNDRFGRIGLAGALGRYASLIGSLIAIVGLVRIFSRVQPFERWSRTRLVEGSAYIRNRKRRYGAAV